MSTPELLTMESLKFKDWGGCVSCSVVLLSGLGARGGEVGIHSPYLVPGKTPGAELEEDDWFHSRNTAGRLRSG